MTRSILAEEIAAEQAFVQRVYRRLDVLRREAAEREAAGYAIARVGTFGALVERDAMVYQAAVRRRALDAEREGLVFGRLDMRAGDVRYVGRLGVRDEQSRSLVVDWRAPAAEAFYRATAADPMGVVRRRLIQSSGEEVTGVEDDLLDPDAAPADLRVVGDGALVASLSRTTGPAMRDIVATIQQEQDVAVRSPGSGVTIIEGGPGTGKTAVALHRVAYLMYSDRQRFAAAGVLVVGPSPVFISYISRVLPSLGEDDVTLAALGSLVVGVEADRHDRPEVAAVKGSLRMVRVLARAARDAAPGTPGGLRLLHRGQLLRLTGADLDRMRSTLLAPGARRNAVRPRAAGLVLDALWRQSTELLPAHQRARREEFAAETAERREFVAFMRAWWPVLRPLDVWGWLADPDRLARYADGVLSRTEIATLAGGLGEQPTIEDIPLVDELHELLGDPPAPRRRRPVAVSEYQELSTYVERMGGARRPAPRPEDYRDYAHVVVDESQDVSPMQWRMLGRRGQHASWTIVGDPAQSAADADPAEALRARDQAVGGRRRYHHTLSTNYRNSVEIYDVAARVIRAALPDLPLPAAVRRSGVDPVHRVVPPGELGPTAAKELAALLEQVAGTVGVITPLGRREELAGLLGGLSADPRVQVVDSLEAKGMEYDGVLLVEPAGIRDESASGVRTLYVALSRATQRLTTVSTVDGWLPDAG